METAKNDRKQKELELNIEITGMPINENENIALTQALKELHIEVGDEEITSCYKLKNKTNCTAFSVKIIETKEKILKEVKEIRKQKKSIQSFSIYRVPAPQCSSTNS